ncbi:Propionate transporter [Fusobacterium necrophorum subsp. necrophorum]|nr:Propionate transporter [Fusobacterium necrophorum subsp. necrophorum]
MSAQASDMSGWLLMGLPGAVFLNGFSEIWVIIGLALGTYANWKWVAPKLRVQTEETETLTLPTFLTKRLGDRTGMIRVFSAIAIYSFLPFTLLPVWLLPESFLKPF